MRLWLDAFPRDWDAALEASVRGRVPTVVYYPGARRDGGSDGTWLRITPPSGEGWTAYVRLRPQRSAPANEYWL